MAWLKAVLIGYGLANIAIGAHGFLGPAKSVVSLIAGAVAGILVLMGVWMAEKNQVAGYGLAALVCLLLIGRFLPTYLQTQDPYPHLVMTILSTVVLVALIVGHFMPKPAA